MGFTVDYNKKYSGWFVHDLLRAIKNYSMVQPHENVCVALSGGKDSVTLLFMLVYLNKYTNCKMTVSAAHVKTAAYDTAVLRDFCDSLDVPYHETDLKDRIPRTKCPCSACARLKRGALSDLLFKENSGKIAFGHHADDVAETFFLNVIHNRKLGSFSPVVQVADCNMSIIRPMIYLTENRICHLHSTLNFPVLDYHCPYTQVNVRNDVREFMSSIRTRFTHLNFSDLLVQSLENVDMSNHWPYLLSGENRR